jgi:hypothetical protein
MTTELTPTNPMSSCEQTTQVLGDYYKGTEDSKDYQARLARAEVDQESALLNQALSDQEIAEEVAKLISLKAVRRSRTLTIEIDKRKALIAAKVTEALEVASDLSTFEAVSLPVGIADLTQYSRPVREISSLRPTMYWGSPGDGPAISAAASSLLNNMKLFEDLTDENN